MNVAFAWSSNSNNIISLGTICVHIDHPNAKPAITFCGGKLVKREVFFGSVYNNKGRLTWFPNHSHCYHSLYAKQILLHRQTQTHPLYLLFSNFVGPTKIIYFMYLNMYSVILGWNTSWEHLKSQWICLQVEKVFVHKLFFVEHSPIIQSKFYSPCHIIDKICSKVGRVCIYVYIYILYEEAFR